MSQNSPTVFSKVVAFSDSDQGGSNLFSVFGSEAALVLTTPYLPGTAHTNDSLNGIAHTKVSSDDTGQSSSNLFFGSEAAQVLNPPYLQA